MSKLVTNFGDSNTTGNTTLQQNLTVQGAFSTFSGNILAGSAFSTLGNSTNKFNTVFATTANIPIVNVTSVFGTTGFVGINTTGGGATLNVAGNVWASNALSAPNVFATVSMNALTANTANIFGPLGVVGINGNPTAGAATLQIAGNVYASNALVSPTVLATTSMNVTGQVNTSAIYGTSGSVGIGTNAGTTGGATLNVAGNVFASNSVVSPNVFALTSMNTPTTNTLSFYGPSGFVGVGTSGSGSTLNVAGNVWASNALAAPLVLATTSMNVVGVTNTSAIYGTSGSVGIGVTGSGSTLNVAGNVWISNALSTPNIFASQANISTLNVSYLSGTNGTVGIGTAATGPAFYVAGNLYASNALTAPNAIVTTMNITSILNTQSIYSATGFLGINTSSATATLHVQGNLYASNALTAPVLVATASMNTPTLNTTSVYGLASLVGINTTVPGASLHVAGNVYASNALTAPAILATTSMNTPTLNTTSVYGLASLVGINTTAPGASLHVQGNLYASNSLTAPIVYATTSMNITTLNTTSIFGTSGQVGIGTTLPSATLQVQGNMYATNAISTTNILATTLNTTVINTASIFGVSGLVGVGSQPIGSTLDVAGNIYASNAITSPNIISGTSNITTLNTTSIYSTSTSVGINTTATGAGITIGGNLYASNALTGTNIIATGTIYYGEDLFKRAPYLTANVANATTIQTWISATCNAADQTNSFWSMSGAPAYGNVAAGPLGSSDYHGSVLLPDGRVLFVPRNASNVGIFNPATGLFSAVSPTGLAATADKFAGGVLLPNGNVVFVPYQSANIGMYNPSALTYSNIFTVAAPSATLFKGGVLAPNGNVIFAPQSSGNVGVFNPTLGTYSNLGPLGIGATAYSGAVLLPTGNVVFVPASSPNIGMYNTYSMTAATAYINIGPIPASGYDGGVLAPNGNVIFIQNTASNVGVYNPTTLSAAGLSNVGPTNVGAGAFAGGCLTPSGNVVMAPYATGNVGLFDPAGLVFSNVNQSAPGSAKFTGATLLPDGRVVFCPYGASNVGLLNTIVPVGPEFCLAPYFNKY
jgi:hypothetical protein